MQTALQNEDRRIGAGPGAWPAAWPWAIAIGLGIAALCGLFFPEIQAAVEIWNGSTAYGHCYLVLPMTLYLLWDRREVLAECSPRPELWWALLGLPIGVVWLVAERLGIMEGRQLMAVAAIELLFLVVLGWRLFWNLSGPLLYLFFLVPFGAFITPILQHFTADFTVVGLNLLGIPNYADNFTIEIPAGTFFVAEACAGLRFLIAAIAFGTFYALLSFRSPTRRAVFMVASVAVPIIANGFRALGIVVLGEILGSAQAAAADHIIYGWVFFSIVMFLLVAAGHPFRETPTVRNPSPPAARFRQPGLAPFLGALLTAVLVGTGPGVAAAISVRAVDSTLSGSPPWQTPPGCAKPVPAAAPSSAIRFSVQCGDQAYAVQIAAFPARSTAGALVVERRRITQELGAEDVSVAPLDGIGAGRGDWTIVRTTDPNRTTAYASWIDGRPSRSGFAARVAQARDSLFGAEHAPVLFTITASERPGVLPKRRQATLDQIRALLEAQAGLDGDLARLSRLH